MNLYMEKKVGNKSFNHSDITKVEADMKDDTKQPIPLDELDKLMVNSYKNKINFLTVHTSDQMMYKFKLDEWLIVEAE